MCIECLQGFPRRAEADCRSGLELIVATSRPESAALSPLAYDSRDQGEPMIRKLPSGGFRLYSRKLNPTTGKRRNLGTFRTRAQAQQHERAVQYFKRGG